MALDIGQVSSLINSPSGNSAVASVVGGTTKSKSSGGTASVAGSAVSGAVTGATVAGPWGGIVGGAVGLITSIFGKKAPPMPGDGGLANATAINAQRDVIRQNPIYQYYASKGVLANPNSPATLLEPPACDAFGSATEALRYMGGVLEAMRKAITSEPLFIKWADKIDPAVIPDYSPKMLMGTPFGLGNPAQSMRVANQTFAIIANAEQAEAEAKYPVVPEITTPLLTNSGTNGTAQTSDIATLATIFTQQQTSQNAFMMQMLSILKPTTPTASPLPGLGSNASDASSAQTAGFDFATLKNLAPALVVFLIVGFIFSNRGVGRIAGN